MDEQLAEFHCNKFFNALDLLEWVLIIRFRTPAVYYADTIAERAKAQYSSPNNADGLIRVHEKLTYTMVRGEYVVYFYGF